MLSLFAQTLANGVCLAALITTAAPDTRLAEAAMHADWKEVRFLLKHTAPVNTAQGDGMTALHWAAYQDHLDTVTQLLRAGADVNAGTRIGGITPLLLASMNGDPGVTRALLDAGANANSANANGTTALMLAASSGNPDAIQVLLEHGAGVNTRESAHGQTALMFAAALNRSAAVKVLLNHGADPEIATSVRELERVRVDSNGNVAYQAPLPKRVAGGAPSAQTGPPAPEAAQRLSVAVQQTKSDLDLFSRALGFKSAAFRHAALTQAADSSSHAFKRVGPEFLGGMTALLYAAREGHDEAVRALLEGHAQIDRSNADKLTPLVVAIINGHLDLAKDLLDHGANPNLATNTGLTPLYATIDLQWAPHVWYPQPSTEQAKISYLDLMQALLERGAQPNARLGDKLWFRAYFSDSTWVDPAGATAFWRAAQSSDIAAMRLLIREGADPKIATKSQDTPLMAAAGVGWAANWSVNAPVPAIEAVKYCVELGNEVNATDSRGFSALHGAAFVGNNEIVLYLVGKGAKVELRSKAGDSPADMANGPNRFAQPHPETVALLEKLGSPNSHNCRSDQCIVQASLKKSAVSGGELGKDALAKLATGLDFQSALYITETPPKPPAVSHEQ